jgi:hypothetical protein
MPRSPAFSGLGCSCAVAATIAPSRAAPKDLTLLAGRGTEAGESLTAGDLVAASQASLNEIVAAIIRGWARKLLAGRECAQCASLSQLGIRIHIRR